MEKNLGKNMCVCVCVCVCVIESHPPLTFCLAHSAVASVAWRLSVSTATTFC